VPADESLRPDDGQGAQDRRKPAVTLHKEPAIAVTQRNPTFDLAPQDNDLMPQKRILSNEFALRLKGAAKMASKNDSRAIIASA